MDKELINRLKDSYQPLHEVLPNAKQVTSTEYHAPCLLCGGSDRLVISAHKGTYWCRQCGTKGDIINYYEEIGKGTVRQQLAAQGLIEPMKKSGKKKSKLEYSWRKAAKKSKVMDRYFKSRHIDPVDSPAVRFSSWEGKNGPVSRVLAKLTKPGDIKVAALHSIFLDTSKEEPVRTKKISKGRQKGRAVWLYPKRDCKTVAVGEGLENTVSFAQESGLDCSFAAALTTSGMQGIVLPEETEEIYVIADQDTTNKGCAGQKAALKLALKFEKTGGKAWIISPSAECFRKEVKNKLDFNDLSGKGLIAERIKVKKRPSDIELTAIPAESGETGIAYPAETMSALEELNKKYAACLLSGKFRIAREFYNEIRGFHSVEFIDKNSFTDFYANRKCSVYDTNGGKKQAKLIKTWMEWEGRRSYDSVVFAPDGKISPTTFNLFRGFAVKPRPGDWSLLKKHMLDGLCHGNEQDYRYLMTWMARIIQDPGGDRPGAAVVLRGGKGLGKGTLANCFGKLFGESYVPVSSAKGLTGDFNMHLAKSLLVFADEAVWGGDKQAEGRLKAMITEPTLDFEPKGIDKMTMKSHINLIMASNEEWAVPASEDERRFFVLDIEKKPYMTTDFFAELYAQMENGGYEAMMHELRQWNCREVNLRDVPQTEGLIKQKLETMGPVMEFWYETLERGFLLSDFKTGGPRSSDINDKDDEDGPAPAGQWPVEVWKHEITKEFQDIFMDGKRHPVKENSFWRQTKKIWPDLKETQKRIDGERPRNVLVPDLYKLREDFTKYSGVPFSRPEFIGLESMPF